MLKLGLVVGRLMVELVIEFYEQLRIDQHEDHDETILSKKMKTFIDY